MVHHEQAPPKAPAKKDRPYAIVVGLDDIRGVHAARTLSRYGIPVIGIARDPKSYGCKTNACDQVLIADPRSEAFVSLLEQLGPLLPEPAVIVPCIDMSVLQLSRHRDRLRQWYRFTLAEADVIEKMSDKVLLYQFCDKAGLPIPKTRFLHSHADIETAVAELEFPLCVKPPNSKDPKWLEATHIKAFKVSDADELTAVFDRWHGVASPLIVQHWIEGPEQNLFACHCYLDADGQPLATFTSRKLRQWPPETGQACLAEESREDRVREITLDLFKQAGFIGLGYVEIKRDEESGEYLIVEPNVGRVSGRMAIAEAGGVELLYTMYCEILGLPLPEGRQQKYGNAKWIYLRQDIQATLKGFKNRRLTLRQWYQSRRGRKKYALLSWRDPKPFIGEFIAGVKLLLSKSERHKRSEPTEQ